MTGAVFFVFFFFFKMAASRFVEVTDEQISCVKENAYFSNNHLCNYTKTNTNTW